MATVDFLTVGFFALIYIKTRLHFTPVVKAERECVCVCRRVTHPEFHYKIDCVTYND